MTLLRKLTVAATFFSGLACAGSMTANETGAGATGTGGAAMSATGGKTSGATGGSSGSGGSPGTGGATGAGGATAGGAQCAGERGFLGPGSTTAKTIPWDGGGTSATLTLRQRTPNGW